MTETPESKDLKFDHWCIVELMGHQRIAGKVTEQTLFGGALMRVDVPAVDGRPGFTKFFGASAIYAVTPVEETVARAMAKSFDTRPIEEWRLSGLLPAPTPTRNYSRLSDDEGKFASGYDEDDEDEVGYGDEYQNEDDDEPHPTAEELDEEDAQWNANRAADMFGADGIDEDGNEYVELQ